MTNAEHFATLSPEQKAEYRKVYESHPLYNYIDWDAFFDSDNGYTLDFVRCESSYENDDGNLVLVLDTITENDEDYKLEYICGENMFQKNPC